MQIAVYDPSERIKRWIFPPDFNSDSEWESYREILTSNSDAMQGKMVHGVILHPNLTNRYCFFCLLRGGGDSFHRPGRYIILMAPVCQTDDFAPSAMGNMSSFFASQLNVSDLQYVQLQLPTTKEKFLHDEACKVFSELKNKTAFWQWKNMMELFVLDSDLNLELIAQSPVIQPQKEHVCPLKKIATFLHITPKHYATSVTSKPCSNESPSASSLEELQDVKTALGNFDLNANTEEASSNDISKAVNCQKATGDTLFCTSSTERKPEVSVLPLQGNTAEISARWLVKIKLPSGVQSQDVLIQFEKEDSAGE